MSRTYTPEARERKRARDRRRKYTAEQRERRNAQDRERRARLKAAQGGPPAASAEHPPHEPARRANGSQGLKGAAQRSQPDAQLVKGPIARFLARFGIELLGGAARI